MTGREQGSEHEFINPPTLSPATGFSHIAVPASGRLVFLAGQTSHQPDGRLLGSTLVEQFAGACANVVTALAAAGAAPTDLMSLQIFVTDVDAYTSALQPIGAAWRAAFGPHYPPMALFGVTRLFDPASLVEMVGIAVVPAGD